MSPVVAADAAHTADAAALPRWLVPAAGGRPAEPRRVLVHQSRFRVGDTLWLTPLLRALRRAFPEAALTVVAGPLSRPVLARSPHVAELVEWEPAAGEAGRRRVLDQLAGTPFDTALFALARRDKSRWLPEAMAERGVPCRVNLEYVDPEGGETAAAPTPLFTHEGWLVWGTLASPRLLLHALHPWLGDGAGSEDRRVDMPVTPEEEREAERVLAAAGIEDRPFSVLAPAGHSSERWPAERFAALAAWLAGEMGHAVLVEGAPADAGLLAEVERRAAHPRVRAATDPLGVFTALLARASLLVSNDSAPIHLAEAAGTPTLYFAHREKLGHSHPAGEVCWALVTEEGEESGPAGVPVEEAREAVREMARRGLLEPARRVAPREAPC
jgi:ADP-heptose:LPS heptosyltransferase